MVVDGIGYCHGIDFHLARQPGRQATRSQAYPGRPPRPTSRESTPSYPDYFWCIAEKNFIEMTAGQLCSNYKMDVYTFN
jgi:hypothetical protein